MSPLPTPPAAANYEPPAEACEYRFVHASGPGGQHVNKTATAVELRVHLAKLRLPIPVLRRLTAAQRNHISQENVLIIQADGFRSQLKNRRDALQRLKQMVAAAWVAPKRRIATQPSRGAKQRRLSHKKQRGEVKANRRQPRVDS